MASQAEYCLIAAVVFWYLVLFFRWAEYQHWLGGWIYIPAILLASYFHSPIALTNPGRVDSWLYIDGRSLAWYRRGLAVLLTAEQFQFRRRDWLSFFTRNDGLGPWPSPWTCLVAFGDFENGGLVRLMEKCDVWSLHAWSDTDWWQDCLRVIALGSALLLFFDVFPRLQCIISAILQVSRNNRNLILVTGADQALVKMLIWGALLPLHGGEDLAVLAALLHLTTVYTLSGMFKTRNPAWLSGDALQYILLGTWREWVRPIGAWLGALPPKVLQVATWGSEVLQAVGVPALLWLPSVTWRPVSRITVVALMVVFHGSLEVILRIKLTSWVFLVWWFLAIPPIAWDACHVPALRRRQGRGTGGWTSLHHPCPQWFAIFFLAYLTYYNWAISSLSRRVFLPSMLQRITWYLGLDEDWTFFVDDAVPVHGWFYSTAHLCDGVQQDGLALFGAGLGGKYYPPPRFPHHFEDPRWCRIFDVLSLGDGETGYAPLAAYMCRNLGPARHIEIGYTDENPFVGNGTRSQIFWNETCGHCNMTSAHQWQASIEDKTVQGYFSHGLLFILVWISATVVCFRPSMCRNYLVPMRAIMFGNKNTAQELNHS